MTSRRGGSEGYKSPPSPPSSGSEDNGFTNRPRVAGLYVKNLSREELDELAKEGIYGPTGNPNDRPRDGGSQRSLNILGSRDLDSQDHFRGATSRTPQPPRRSGIAVKHREPDGRLSETLVRKDHHGSLPTERGWSRRPEDQPEQTLPERSARGSSEFLIGWRESLRPSVSASPRESSIDVRITDEDVRTAAGQCHFREAPKRPEVPSRRVISSTGPSEDQSQSPPPYAGLSPPKYTEYEESSSRASKIFPKTTTRVYQADDKEHTSSPYERPSSPSLKEDKESLFPQMIAKSPDSRADTDKADEITSPSGTEKLTSPESKKSESPPMKRIGFRTQDSMRLRPPLAGTAGTSADSGTGDSGSAEIQADVVTPQTASGDILDTKESKIESRSCARTPSSKGGKQTVKPFTKESRLENKTVQLVREYGFQPKKKMSVEDGAVLPNKFEPFPNNLYGRPLEEIDNFIYDEVSSQFRRTYLYFFIFYSSNKILR
ncbi:Sodium channel protein 60E [Trachymyrmex zeteki]|uniref:Sodium channel protein 60E n=1 Tax=Mycetomoellerius zeteki TaxID=64791 RepID=A0A151X8G8_9HYME|nr:Sodium channel protein 60E [Trachymyrmex zeteki]